MHPQSEHEQSEPHPQSEQHPDTRRRRCRHIFAAGRQCGSPCLRAEQFCYYHHTTRRPVSDPRARTSLTGVHDLPAPECRDSIRAALAQVMYAIAHNTIDPRRAGLLLYNLQIALCALPKEPPMPRAQSRPEARPRPQTKRERTRQLRREFIAEQEKFEARQAAEAARNPGAPFRSLDSDTWASPSPEPEDNAGPVDDIRATRDSGHNPKPNNNIPTEPLIEDTVLDDTHGLIAPETFLEPEPEAEEAEEDQAEPRPRKSFARQLYEEVLRYEARLKAEQEGYERARADLLQYGKLDPPASSQTAAPPPQPGLDIDACADDSEVVPSSAAECWRAPSIAPLSLAMGGNLERPVPGARCPIHRAFIFRDEWEPRMPGAPSIAPLSLAMGGNLGCSPASHPNPLILSQRSVILSGVWRALAPNAVEGSAVRSSTRRSSAKSPERLGQPERRRDSSLSRRSTSE